MLAKRKSKAQTPAPKKDRVFGSKTNKPKSASSSKTAKKIVFGNRVESSIVKKVNEHNSKNIMNKVSLSTAKAVVRRGLGAYSISHRPNVTRVQWGLARLNQFLKKKSGEKVKKAYTQDDDLL